MAGAYALQSTEQLTREKARRFLAQYRWSDFVPSRDDHDHARLLSHLMTHPLRVPTSHGLYVEKSVAELINALLVDSGEIAPERADECLRRIGLRVSKDKTVLHVANNHPRLTEVLRDTPWARNWKTTLLRISEARPSKGAIRFGPADQQRATDIPLHAILGE